MAYFAADHHHYEKMIQKYADFLNGGPEEAPHEGEVIVGPWKTDSEMSAHAPRA